MVNKTRAAMTMLRESSRCCGFEWIWIITAIVRYQRVNGSNKHTDSTDDD